MRSASRPCSPVRHHEGHAKLTSSPPRASPVRMGPSYVLKKGWRGRAGRVGRQGGRAHSSGPGARVMPWLPPREQQRLRALLMPPGASRGAPSH